MIQKILSILFCFLALMHDSASAQTATLTDIIVTNNRDDLLLYLNVEGAFQDEVKAAVLSGVPTTFSFAANLNKIRSLWLDKNLTDIEVTHTIKYNNLKKEFVVKRSWEQNQPRTTQSFEEAQRWMSEIDSLRIISLKQLEKGRQYQLRAKAELKRVTLPFYLHYVLFFVSLWDFETDWYAIDFTY